jgi:hypothetical protein
LTELVVELLDRRQRVVEQPRGRAQRVARQRGERRRFGTATGDVADEDDPAAGDFECVVEVAADLALLTGCPVQAGEPEAVDCGKLRGQ